MLTIIIAAGSPPIIPVSPAISQTGIIKRPTCLKYAFTTFMANRSPTKVFPPYLTHRSHCTRCLKSVHSGINLFIQVLATKDRAHPRCTRPSSLLDPDLEESLLESLLSTDPARSCGLLDGCFLSRSCNMKQLPSVPHS